MIGSTIRSTHAMCEREGLKREAEVVDKLGRNENHR
jgi:hypothetical protein